MLGLITVLRTLDEFKERARQNVVLLAGQCEDAQRSLRRKCRIYAKKGPANELVPRMIVGGNTPQRNGSS
jgi:hypothetical protein